MVQTLWLTLVDFCSRELGRAYSPQLYREEFCRCRGLQLLYLHKMSTQVLHTCVDNHGYNLLLTLKFPSHHQRGVNIGT